MQLHDVKPIHKNTTTMIVGRGGKRGKTSGRGTKGQNARAGHKNRPEMRDFIKRLPKLRGRGVSPFKSFAVKPVGVNLSSIEALFKNADIVTPKTLIEKGLVPMMSGNIPKVKILADRAVTEKKSFATKIAVSGCLTSAGAKALIEKAGGTVK